MSPASSVRISRKAGAGAFGGGLAIGVLGGLIGLGGAEFRLPLLIGAFRFGALEAVIVNKAMSLVVVAAALPMRTGKVPAETLAAHWPILLDLLAGSLLGAWVGAGWATRLASQTLHRVIAVLLVAMAAALLAGHGVDARDGAMPAGATQLIAGVAAGFAIGVVASLMGVAGGELLIPTLVLLFGLDLKLAGSLSLCISLPTMLAGFARYSRDRAFAVLAANWTFVVVMAAGSIAGSFLGAVLLGVVPVAVLLPALSAVLLISAAKVWRHGQGAT